MVISSEAFEDFVRQEIKAAMMQGLELNNSVYQIAVVVMRSRRIIEKMEGKDIPLSKLFRIKTFMSGPLETLEDNNLTYGDYSGALKPNKGKEGGACNVTTCQAEPAIYYNHGSHSWYCLGCKKKIGEDPVNRRTWSQDFRRLFPYRSFHPMFETREEMTIREKTSFLI